MNRSWQNDWNEFLDALAESIRTRGAEQCAQQFGGSTVEWSGVLAEKSLDCTAVSVTIQFPERRIDVGDGRSAVIDHVFLPVDGESVALWRPLRLGRTIQFSATFCAADSVFPPIEVKDLQDGPTIVMIRMTNAVPQD